MSELKVASCFEFEKVLRGRSNKLFYSKSEVDAVLDEKDKIIAELKEQYKDMDVTHTVHIAKMNAKIEELESNERRLKRALYKACAMWADRTRLICSVFGSDAPRIRWERMLGKCRAMAEKYK